MIDATAIAIRLGCRRSACQGHTILRIRTICNFMRLITSKAQQRGFIKALTISMGTLASIALKGRASSKIVYGLPPSYSIHLVNWFGSLIVMDILRINILVFFIFHFFILWLYNLFSRHLIYWRDFRLRRENGGWVRSDWPVRPILYIRSLRLDRHNGHGLSSDRRLLWDGR